MCSTRENSMKRHRSPPRGMNIDDAETGRILTRREILAYMGVSGAARLAGWPLVHANGTTDVGGVHRRSCIARPQQTAGPFFIDERLHRSDIRSDPATGEERPGVPLDLTFTVSQLLAGSCSPLASAAVDIWHCDALGVYSDVDDGSIRTAGQKFLRGYQVTDASGAARFRTIYPGWYPGRTVHVNFKVRTRNSNGGYEFTSQVYFPEELTDQVHARAPYSSKGRRTTRNRDDGLYRREGNQLLIDAPETTEGVAASFDVALQIA
jgi:protocatechuate 3,4-dioxygenase beta subunit